MASIVILPIEKFKLPNYSVHLLLIASSSCPNQGTFSR